MIRRRRNIDAQSIAEFDPPISVFNPKRQAGPLILASPHSGRHYPKAFIERAAASAQSLRQNEDAYIDELLGFARHLDIPLLCALFPRSFVDVNRDRTELPVTWRLAAHKASTARAEMGLGVVPTIIAEHKPIYKKAPKASEVQLRLEHLYDPYHDALSGLIRDTQLQFGSAILLDCHSMPGFTQMGQRRPDIVLGDRHGTSCRPETMSALESLFKAKGYSTTRNYPYAGGFVTSHYGQPENNIEVIQIEINRDIYLNPVNFHRKPGYARLADDLKSICWQFMPRAQDLPAEFPAEFPLAAE